MDHLSWVNLIVAQESAPAGKLSALDLVLESSGVVLLVLLLLIGASIACWFIIGYKAFALGRAQRQTRQFHEIFWNSKKLDEIFRQAEGLPYSPVSQVYQAGYQELRKLKNQEAEGTMRMQLGGLENVERALRRAIVSETAYMERLVPFLATIGSTAPFIGLFGTVWGIMIAFMRIGETGQAGIDVVSAPIAEALIATAIGLVAAIPAVMAYNFFNAKIRSLGVEMENFSNDFLNIVKRSFFK